MPQNQTWVAYLRKPDECFRAEVCERETRVMAEGDPAVRGRIREVLISWHPECWVKGAISLLLSTPYRETGPGRKKLDISDTERTARRKILGRHSSLEQRILTQKHQLDRPNPNIEVITLRINRFEVLQDVLWWELQKLGGAPTTWKVPDGAEVKEGTGILRTPVDTAEVQA